MDEIKMPPKKAIKIIAELFNTVNKGAFVWKDHKFKRRRLHMDYMEYVDGALKFKISKHLKDASKIEVLGFDNLSYQVVSWAELAKVAKSDSSKETLVLWCYPSRR